MLGGRCLVCPHDRQAWDSRGRCCRPENFTQKSHDLMIRLIRTVGYHQSAQALFSIADHNDIPPRSLSSRPGPLSVATELQFVDHHGCRQASGIRDWVSQVRQEIQLEPLPLAAQGSCVTPPIAFGELDHRSYHFLIPSLELRTASVIICRAHNGYARGCIDSADRRTDTLFTQVDF